MMRNPFIYGEPLNPRIHKDLLYQRPALDLVSGLIDERSYVLVMGPRYSGRTTLLKQICALKTTSSGYAAVYIRPDMLDLADENRFFVALRKVIEIGCRTISPRDWPSDLPPVERSDDFNRFLNELMKRFRLCLLLAFDDIEDIPPDILTRLANIAHAVYSERSLQLEYRNLCALFAGSTSLRHLTYRQKPHLSPFNVCEDVVLNDVTATECRRFVEGVMERSKLRFRDDAIHAIVQYAGGDLNSVQQIAQLAQASTRQGVDVDRSAIVNAVEILTGTSGDKVSESLRRTAISVEEDKAVLDIVLQLLHSGVAPYTPSSDEQELFSVFRVTGAEMTGALRLERSNGEPISWHFRNKLTELFLRRYLAQPRVVRAYSALGDFRRAAEYCDPLLDLVRIQYEENIEKFDDSILKDILIAYTNCIYAEGAYEAAFRFLAAILKRGFGCKIAVYHDYVQPEGVLRAVEFLAKFFDNDGSSIQVSDPQNRDRVEVRALDTKLYSWETIDGDAWKIAIPLQSLQGQVTGIVTLRMSKGREPWSLLNLRVKVIERALHVLNIALNKVEADSKKRIEDSVSILKSGGEAPGIFVAHQFNKELLINLREHLGRVSLLWKFTYADEASSSGALSQVVEAAIRSASLCLYEVSHSNCNVYYELGLGVGVNKPGLMFWRALPNSRAELPQVLMGINRINYEDYTSLLERLSEHVDEALKHYLVHNSDQTYIHFVGATLPPVEKRADYAVVLDSNAYGDQRDYRRAITESFKQRDIQLVFLSDTNLVLEEVLANRDHQQRADLRILGWFNLIRHADVIVARIEKTQSALDGQVFVGLGLAYGMGKQRIWLSHRIRDFGENNIEVPADLRSKDHCSYVAISEFATWLERKIKSTDWANHVQSDRPHSRDIA
jgi:hypothetical protein